MILNIVNREDLFPSVLVSVRAPTEVLGREEMKDTLAVVDWHMPTSISPTKYAISVKNDDNISRMISKAGNFVVNFMSYEQRSIVLSCESQDGVLIDWRALGLRRPRLFLSVKLSMSLRAETI